MKKFWKNKIVLAIGVIILLLICFTGLYLLNRSIQLKNNDLLLKYDTLKAVSYKEERVNNSIYKDYFFGKNIGRVIIENDGKEMTVRDDRYGFIKSYRNGILYYVLDLKKENLIGGLTSYFNPKVWFGGGRVVKTKGKFIRTTEECKRLSQLLKEKKYNKITEDKKNRIIITHNGTYFVN